MTESSSADQGYWVSPFEDLAQQEDALWDETQGLGVIPPQTGSTIGPPGVDASTFDSQQGYDDTSAIRTQEEYVPEQFAGQEFAAPVQVAPYDNWYAPGSDMLQQDAGNANTFQEPYAPNAYVPVEGSGAPAVDPAGFGGGSTEVMLASWYGPGFHGSPTASGEPFDPYGFTAAHKTLPFGTKLMVTYGGSSVPVTVNDRGPFTGDRDLDLSEGAAQALGITQTGVDYVEVSYPGGEGYGPGTPVVDPPYVPPNTYDPNVPITPGDEVFIPEEEFGDPYDDDLDA